MKIDTLISTLGSLIGGFLAIVLIVVAAINNKSHECKGKVVDSILKLKRKINSTMPDSINLKKLNEIRKFCSEIKSRICDLHLMSVDTADGLVNEGHNLVIVALVGTNLHIRIFDANGKRVVDKVENELMTGETLTTFKKQLNLLLEKSDLSLEKKQKIIQDATSIAGHTQSCSVDFWLDQDQQSDSLWNTVKNDEALLDYDNNESCLVLFVGALFRILRNTNVDNQHLKLLKVEVLRNWVKQYKYANVLLGLINEEVISFYKDELTIAKQAFQEWKKWHKAERLCSISLLFSVIAFLSTVLAGILAGMDFSLKDIPILHYYHPGYILAIFAVIMFICAILIVIRLLQDREDRYRVNGIIIFMVLFFCYLLYLPIQHDNSTGSSTANQQLAHHEKAEEKHTTGLPSHPLETNRTDTEISPLEKRATNDSLSKTQEESSLKGNLLEQHVLGIHDISGVPSTTAPQKKNQPPSKRGKTHIPRQRVKLQKHANRSSN
jgi:hypothetical protein